MKTGCFKKNKYVWSGGNSVKYVFLCQLESTQKERNLFHRSKFLSLRVDRFAERNFLCRKVNRKSKKLSPLKNGRKIYQVYQFVIICDWGKISYKRTMFAKMMLLKWFGASSLNESPLTCHDIPLTIEISLHYNSVFLT